MKGKRSFEHTLVEEAKGKEKELFYHDFKKSKNETGVEPVQVGVGDEASEDREQERRA